MSCVCINLFFWKNEGPRFLLLFPVSHCFLSFFFFFFKGTFDFVGKGFSYVIPYVLLLALLSYLVGHFFANSIGNRFGFLIYF